MASQLVKLVLMLLSAKCVASYCFGGTKIATTNAITEYIYTYRNNQDCTISIQPSSLYSSGYYLEIAWLKFDVKGDMPDCKNDYVEVYVTRSYKSIGKYCSNNLKSTSLFNMFSSDGYAKIKFHSDGSDTGRGFDFQFILKQKSTRSLGSSTSTNCGISTRYSRSGNVYSQGWPAGYSKSYSTCEMRLVPGSDVGTKIAIMDVDLNNNGYYKCSGLSDYVSVGGKDYSSYVVYYTVAGKMCSTSSIKSFTTNYKYVKFEFLRWSGSSSKRGFVAGYVIYSLPTTKLPSLSTTRSPTSYSTLHSSYSTSTGISGMVAGIIIGVIFVCILAIAIPVWLCRRNSRQGGVVRQRNTAGTGTTIVQQTTAQSMVNPLYQFSADEGSAAYPTGTYPTSTTDYTMPTQSQAHPPPMQPGVPADASQQPYPPGSAPYNQQPAPAYPGYPPADGQGQPLYPNQPPQPCSQAYPPS